MADEPTQGTPTTPQPQENTPVPQNTGTPSITPKDIEGKSPDEIVKFVAEKAESWGKSSAEAERIRKWATEAAPYIETITADPELAKMVEEKHNARLGIKKEDKKAEAPSPTDAKVDDTRKALSNSIISSFEQTKGLDKLTGDDKKEMNVKIGQQLMKMLDPYGTKSYDEVIDSVPLERLPGILDDAYYLATKDDQLQKIKDAALAEAQSGQTGIMSSIPSSSTEGENVQLTNEERVLAQKMGVTPEKWLERKKQILSRNK